MEQIQLTDTKKLNKNGYILIKVYDKYIYEHTFIMEQFIGRKLNKGEVIHHLDHNTQNNRISNLMLFKSQKEHESFENKVRQFGFTRPIIKKINSRFNQFNKEIL